MKKSLRVLEAVASTSLMASKYFLAISSIYGWYLSILGYVLITVFNIKLKLKIAPIVVGGLAILCMYGLYKWSYEIKGLQIFDYAVIILSSIFSTIMIISEARKKKPLWFVQSIANVIFTFAFIALGLKMEIGWYALLLGHINNTYMYYKKEAYIVGVMQIISIIIVLFRIF